VSGVYQRNPTLDGLRQLDSILVAMLIDSERELGKLQHKCVCVAILDVGVNYFTNLIGGDHD
jgi:hypothetical protein